MLEDALGNGEKLPGARGCGRDIVTRKRSRRGVTWSCWPNGLEKIGAIDTGLLVQDDRPNRSSKGRETLET